MNKKSFVLGKDGYPHGRPSSGGLFGKKIQMINGKVQVFRSCSSRWRRLSSMLMSASYR